jgi:tetratricopeptide (TPR) repeat protein
MIRDNERQSDDAAYKQGLALLREGKTSEGIELLRGVSARMPRALGDIIWSYRTRGDNDSAFACLEQYVEKFPDDPGGWALRAKIAFERKDFEDAARYARRVVALHPTDERLWFELGDIFSTCDWKSAARAYGECLKINPRNTKALVLRKHALYQRGLGRIRTLAKVAPVRAFLRWVLSSELMGDLIELDMGIAREDVRWEMPLECDRAAPFSEPVPGDQTPDRFAAHFQQCRCPFWQWFRALRFNGKVRKVLEMGGGAGHVAHHFASAGFDVLSLTRCEKARRDREQRGIAALSGDFHLLRARGGSFDLLVAAHALQQSRSPHFALWEWKRLLRPDGYLIVMAHLPLDRPAPPPPSAQEGTEAEHLAHFTHGVAGHVMTLSYWQLRSLIKRTGLQLVAETLEDPESRQLESVEHVDGRRPRDPSKAWNLLVLLRKPGRLPFDGEIERPRGVDSPSTRPPKLGT